MEKLPADILKEAREKKGWRQADMAEKLGISARQYHKFEQGFFPKYKREVIEKIDGLLGTALYGLIYEPNIQFKGLPKFSDRDSSLRKLPDFKIVKGSLEETIGQMREVIIRQEASITVLSITLAEAVSKITGKEIGAVSVGLSKAIDEEADRIFERLGTKTRDKS